MEINRVLLRKNAWNSLKGIYWFMFLACIAASLVGANSLGGGFAGFWPGAAGTSANNPSAAWNDFVVDVGGKNAAAAILIIVGAVIVVFWILALLFGVFISGPAVVSFAKIKLSAVVGREKNAMNVFFAFANRYLRNVRVIFLQRLYIFLWTLPLALLIGGTGAFMVFRSLKGDISPAMGLSFLLIFLLLLIALFAVSIWKSYQYMLVPYIAADDVSVGARQAIRLSTEMMRGFKWQAFVLRLSFLGWYILGLLLCGVGVLFVEPYYQAAETLLYEELKAITKERPSVSYR